MFGMHYRLFHVTSRSISLEGTKGTSPFKTHTHQGPPSERATLSILI